MTLANVFSEDKTNKIIEVMPPLVGLWKIVGLSKEEGFNALHMGGVYGCGHIKANVKPMEYGNKGQRYMSGFHFWVKKEYVLERLNSWLVDIHRILKDFIPPYFDNYYHSRDPYASRHYPYPHQSERISENHLLQVIWELEQNFPCVVKAVARKEWITAIGTQDNGLAVVCSEVVMPRYPEINPYLELYSNDIVPSANTMSRYHDVPVLESNEKVMALVKE